MHLEWHVRAEVKGIVHQGKPVWLHFWLRDKKCIFFVSVASSFIQCNFCIF